MNNKYERKIEHAMKRGFDIGSSALGLVVLSPLLLGIAVSIRCTSPGITGLAQVNGFRGDTSIEARTSYDLRYIEKWTLGMDARILFRTLFGGMINKQEYPELEKGAGKGWYHQ